MYWPLNVVLQTMQLRKFEGLENERRILSLSKEKALIFSLLPFASLWDKPCESGKLKGGSAKSLFYHASAPAATDATCIGLHKHYLSCLELDPGYDSCLLSLN